MLMDLGLVRQAVDTTVNPYAAYVKYLRLVRDKYGKDADMSYGQFKKISENHGDEHVFVFRKEGTP